MNEDKVNKELLRQKEKKEKFEFYKRQIEEDYEDLNSEEIESLYDRFCELGETNLGIDMGGKYDKFLDFVLKNTSDRDEYLEEMIEEYEKETDSEEEEEEEDDNYDDIYDRK